MYVALTEAGGRSEQQYFTDKHGTVHPITGRDMPEKVKHSLTTKLAIPAALGAMLLTGKGRGIARMGLKVGKKLAKAPFTGLAAGGKGVATAAAAIKRGAVKVIAKTPTEAGRKIAKQEAIKKGLAKFRAGVPTKPSKVPDKIRGIKGALRAAKRGYRTEKGKPTREATKRIIGKRKKRWGIATQMSMGSTGISKLGAQPKIPKSFNIPVGTTPSGKPIYSGRSFIRAVSPGSPLAPPLAGMVHQKSAPGFIKRVGQKIKRKIKFKKRAK